MKEWTTACPDWESKIARGESIVPVGALFPDVASAALEIFNSLKVADVLGSPEMGSISKEWVYEFVIVIFGSYDPEIQRRLITDYFLLISKKNSKSTLAAAIMLTMLILNSRKSAEFLIISPTIEIAKNSFIPCRDMILGSEELNKLFHIQQNTKVITHKITKATLSVVAAEDNTVGGKKATGVLIDEIWLFGKRPNAEQMFMEATGGLASRPEGFIIYLTTQSDQPPAGVFKKKLMYARKVRDGEIVDKKFLPVLYEFPPKMIEDGSYKNPDNFHITNPNLGASVDEEFLLSRFREAQENGPESTNQFFAKHLNVEIGLNLRTDRWAGADFWLGQVDEQVTYDYIMENSEVVTVGIDGGGLDDLLGFYAIGRHKDTGQWLGWGRAWAHPSVLERRKSEISKILDFAQDGDLVLVERVGDDTREVAEIVKDIYDRDLLDKVGVDPHGLGGILEELDKMGVPEDYIIGISQGWKLTGAIKTCERKLAEGAFWHGGQGLMTWTVGNARVVPSGNAVMINKQVSGAAKIDTVMAMLNAVSLMQLNPEAANKSPYNERGFLMV